MKIGILSDTHGNVPRTHLAIERLNRGEVEAIIHCGDIGTPAVLIELSLAFEPRQTPIYAVTGNVDQFNTEIYPWHGGGGIEMMGAFGSLELDGKRLAVAHGHDYQALQRAIEGGDYDYVFTGHTHVAEDHRVRKTRVINPGAVHRASIPSVAILDLNNDDLRYYDLLS